MPQGLLVPPAVATDFASSCVNQQALEAAAPTSFYARWPAPYSPSRGLGVPPGTGLGRRTIGASPPRERAPLDRPHPDLTQVDRRIGGLPPKTAPAFGIEATEVPWPIPSQRRPDHGGRCMQDRTDRG